MIIFLIIIGIGLFFGLAILLAGGIVWSQSSAKKEAKKILTLGKIENHKKFEQISKTLATTQNDLEAADLWKRLQELQQTNK